MSRLPFPLDVIAGAGGNQARLREIANGLPDDVAAEENLAEADLKVEKHCTDEKKDLEQCRTVTRMSQCLSIMEKVQR